MHSESQGQLDEKSEILFDVCQALSSNDFEFAASMLRERYPFEPMTKTPSTISKFKSIQIFERDGYRDRYTGQRLIFPGTLLLISKYLPEQFPTHPNWKTEQTHFAYYELWPVIDHVQPLTRKGDNSDCNLVTTSALRNAAKANFTLAELDWKLLDVPPTKNWDGLTNWFSKRIEGDAGLVSDPLIGRWSSALKRWQVISD